MKSRSIRQFLVVFLFAVTSSTLVMAETLPTREAPIPQTSNGVPHVQIGVKAIPELSEKLLRQVAKLPGVKLGATRVSLPGAVGFQLADDVSLAHPEAIVGGREFAHLHPDGSLHASLSPQLAQEAVAAGWAIHHPWSDQRSGWEGFVMIYTPQTDAELDVVFELVAKSYEYVTGRQHNYPNN